MKKIIAFFRLLRFKWMFSSPLEKAIWCVFGTVFAWSGTGFIASLFGWQLPGHGLPFAIGLLASGLSVLKDVLGFANQFKSDNELELFKDWKKWRHDDILKLKERWENIQNDGQEGFSSIRKLYVNGDFEDFYSWSQAVNKALVDGVTIHCHKVPERKTTFWRTIHENLAEALLFITLRQKANQYENFQNERKIAVVAPLSLQNANDVLDIYVAKSCYYASYLTNEFYRDWVYDGRDKSIRLTGGGKWDPFHGCTTSLPSFYVPRSFHVGVNTLGITMDGRVCLWLQNKGNYSQDLVAPTGSGSMDWSDIRHMRNDNFSYAVKFGAERELREESFSRETRQKLKETGKKLDSRITGLFRWGSRGGLPGFMLVTTIPLRYDQIIYAGKDAFGKNAECLLATEAKELKLSISPDNLFGKDEPHDVDVWREKSAAMVDHFQSQHAARISVPLYACFDFFKEALSTNQVFAQWLFDFLET